tara:strand:+ start:134 stop:310 length:177 start_codon:yes stop_codon:yes gene_type:complete
LILSSQINDCAGENNNALRFPIACCRFFHVISDVIFGVIPAKAGISMTAALGFQLSLE